MPAYNRQFLIIYILLRKYRLVLWLIIIIKMGCWDCQFQIKKNTIVYTLYFWWWLGEEFLFYIFKMFFSSFIKKCMTYYKLHIHEMYNWSMKLSLQAGLWFITPEVFFCPFVISPTQISPALPQANIVTTD